MLGTAPHADAADGYKYWNYFHVQNGKYAFAKTGPSGFVPKDGAVEAYRYGLSSTAAGITPRTDPTTYTAEDICTGTKAEGGQKLVGVLLDYGTADDADSGDEPPAPRAACAAVPTAANGQQVLDAVADVRVAEAADLRYRRLPGQRLLGHREGPTARDAEDKVDFALPEAAAPKKDAATDPASAESDEGGVSWPLVGVVALVVVLGGAALVLSRRAKSA